MKTNIRIQNKGNSSCYLILHLSSDLMLSYTQRGFTSFASAYFIEYLPPNGEIYNYLTDTFQIAGLSMEYGNIKSSVTRRLDYHTDKQYVLTEQYDIIESSEPPSCVRNDTNEVRSVILFCNDRVIYCQRIRPMMSCQIPSLNELMKSWSISYSSTKNIPTYFSTNIPGIQPLWTGQGLYGGNNTYMTFRFLEICSTGQVSLSEPDFSPFSMV